MNPEMLTQLYDDIKQDSVVPVERPKSLHINQGSLDASPVALAWRNKAAHHAEHLKDHCRKHILMDIYCKILPLDKDWIADNQGQMMQDIDSMLDTKGTTATQYLKSAYESTNAPFVEYLLRSTDMIGRTYMEEQEEILKDAQENDVDAPEPKDPVEDNDEEIKNSLVDVTNDTEYENFIEVLKKKTIDKIVDDITGIIDENKSKNDITFNAESAVVVSMDYLQKQNWGSELTESQNNEMIGMSIREATLHEFDLVFAQDISFNEYATKIRTGKGAVVNEACVSKIKNI